MLKLVLTHFDQVIIVDFNSLDRILKTGSALYRKYQLSQSHQHSCVIPSVISAKSNEVFRKAVKSLKMIELLDSNSALRKLTAVQKRHLQCIVEGPTVYSPGQRLWRAGAAVDKAFIIVAGTVSFVPKRRHGGSAMNEKRGKKSSVRVKKKHETKVVLLAEADDRLSLGESMKSDAVRAVRELHVVSWFEVRVLHFHFSISSLPCVTLSSSSRRSMHQVMKMWTIFRYHKIMNQLRRSLIQILILGTIQWLEALKLLA